MTAKLKTMQDLRDALEERRRSTLGLLRTLDRFGLGSHVLGRPAMTAYAEADSECIARLMTLRTLPGDLLLHRSEEARCTKLLAAIDLIERDVLELLPHDARQIVEEKRPVGELTVDDEDIYPPEYEVRPAPSRRRR